VSDDYRDVPYLSCRLLREGTEIGQSAWGLCEELWDSHSWDNACGTLWPGISCEGYKAFQVPEATQVQGLVAEGQFHYWNGPDATASWLLEP
jgi:hypothetical protein